MSEEITVIDPCSSDEWMQLVHTHPDAGIFHHPAWIRLIRETYGYPMFAVCMKRGGKIAAGISMADVQSGITGHRFVSLPFSDECCPLIPRDDEIALKSILSFLRNHIAPEVPRIEIHADVGESGSTFREQNFVRHTLDLTRDTDALRASFDRRTAQRSIRIAEQKGVVVRECRTKEEFDVYYGLHVKTRKRLGVPVQPKALFNGIWEKMVKPGLGFALIAFKNETPLGGGVFFRFKNTVMFKYSASDMEYKSFQPSHALIWSAVQRARERGCTMLDFGRTDRTHEQLRRFKKTWGATELDLNYTVVADHPRPERLSKLGGILGHIIRHSPEFVCRASGRMLYRHFA